MMFPVLRRAVLVMIIIVRASEQRMMRPAICHTSMLQRHMPGGKKPAKQRQQSEDATV